jgi:GDP/UDP-N,N'-diacetylbacillosamine 2-epimerase (hydrolysing)
MARAVSVELAGLTDLWSDDRPDLVLVLGDRGEMVAGALAGVMLNIPVAHIHGGERSGTIDESFRHAISKLSHFHFPATQASADRLIAMGEDPARIHVIGAPGLVGVPGEVESIPTAEELRRAHDLPADRLVALTVFHPVVQEQEDAAAQVSAVIAGARSAGLSQILFRPNSDAGGSAVDAVIDSAAEASDVAVATHVSRPEYLAILASVDLLLGNSSSGIIESASFGVPCVNVGSRQHGRERNANTVDVPQINEDAVRDGIRKALALSPDNSNVYGDGTADQRLLQALSADLLDPAWLTKEMTY